jgi:hypothetical protein
LTNETNYFPWEFGLAQARLNDGLGSNPAANERCLIQRALAGDPDAVSPLFARYRRRLFRAAFSLLFNREDAKDALQDGLLRAYVHLHSFQGRSQFCIWLTRIVVSGAFDGSSSKACSSGNISR